MKDEAASANPRCCCKPSPKWRKAAKCCTFPAKESAQQVALRAQRLELPTEGVNLLAEIRMEAIQTALKQHQPEVVVIDSIQTMYSDQITSAPGSVSQVRECAAQLTRMAKQMGIAMILVGHVTKDGAIAGPRVLEHMSIPCCISRATNIPTTA